MTDCELVQMLSDGYRVIEISVEKSINKRTLEKRILVLRERCVCKTVTHLVANYLRRGLIK